MEYSRKRNLKVGKREEEEVQREVQKIKWGKTD